MNSIYLYNSISEIDDDLICQANIFPAHKHKLIRNMASIAAVVIFTICIGIGTHVYNQDVPDSMGGNQPDYISENTKISYIGTGFTQQEIEQLIDSEKENIVSIICDEYGLIDESISIYTKGYSHITCGEELSVNLDALTLPILVNNEIRANIELVRVDNEIIHTINIGGDKWGIYNDTLKNNPESEIAFAFLGDTAGEVVILPDNSAVAVTQDANSNFDTETEWYSLLKTEYNSFSLNDLKNEDNLLVLN